MRSYILKIFYIPIYEKLRIIYLDIMTIPMIRYSQKNRVTEQNN